MKNEAVRHNGRFATGLNLLKNATILSGALALAACSSDVMRFSGSETTGSVRSSSQAMVPAVEVPNPTYSGGSYNGGVSRDFSSAPLDNSYDQASYGQQPSNTPFQVRNEQPAGFEGNRFEAFYTVQPGDSLQSIARQYNTSPEQLASTNGIRPGEPLFTGQQLSVPGGARSQPQQQMQANNFAQPAQQQPVQPILSSGTQTASASSTSSGRYTVQSGDTLHGVARRHNMTVSQLASQNGLSTDAGLRIGQVLTVSGNHTQVAAASPTATQSRQVTSDALPAGNSTVQQGQTLQSQSQAINQSSQSSQPQQTAYSGNVRMTDDTTRAQQSTATQSQQQLTQQAALQPDTAPAQRLTNTFRWPVTGRVVSDFGRKPDGSHNDGINIAVPEGTPIKAAENGVVVYAGDEIKGYGNLILVRHADDYVTAYAHAKDVLVKRGDTVTRGQDIATAGSTGAVTSPQVHFEIRRGARPVDPRGYLPGSQG